MLQSIEHPDVGKLSQLGIPFRFSRSPGSVDTAPPTLAQHTDDVLENILQLSDERIAALRRAGAVG